MGAPVLAFLFVFVYSCGGDWFGVDDSFGDAVRVLLLGGVGDLSTPDHRHVYQLPEALVGMVSFVFCCFAVLEVEFGRWLVSDEDCFEVNELLLEEGDLLCLVLDELLVVLGGAALLRE